MGPLVRTVWRSYQRPQAFQAPLHTRPRPSADRLSDGRGPARRGRPDARAVPSTPRGWSAPSRSRSLHRARVANSRMIPAAGSPDGCPALSLTDGTFLSRVTEAGMTRVEA